MKFNEMITKNSRRRAKTRLLFVVGTVILVSTCVGCAMLNDLKSQVKGNLVGQSFAMQFYDDYGDNTLTVSGTKVSIGAVTNKTKDKEGNTTEAMTSVLDITINGSQVLQVGNTMVCLEDGVSMIKGADIPSSIKTTSGGGFIPFDRNINSIKNKLGTKKTVVISSQQGVPIGVVQGNDVYATVPSDLPKMTRLNVDGKSVYIHRANYVILDTDLIKEVK